LYNNKREAPTAIGNLSGLGEFTTTPGANFAETL